MVSRDDVIRRLKDFGYEATDADNDHIDFNLSQIIDYVYNFCHITEIPELLDSRIIDRVCAMFLFEKKNSGTLENFDYEIPIKQIKEGDTTLQYSVDGEDTPENRFDSLVNRLERGFDKWLTHFRRLDW